MTRYAATDAATAAYGFVVTTSRNSIERRGNVRDFKVGDVEVRQLQGDLPGERGIGVDRGDATDENEERERAEGDLAGVQALTRRGHFVLVGGVVACVEEILLELEADGTRRARRSLEARGKSAATDAPKRSTFTPVDAATASMPLPLRWRARSDSPTRAARRSEADPLTRTGARCLRATRAELETTDEAPRRGSRWRGAPSFGNAPSKRRCTRESELGATERNPPRHSTDSRRDAIGREPMNRRFDPRETLSRHRLHANS